MGTGANIVCCTRQPLPQPIGSRKGLHIMLAKSMVSQQLQQEEKGHSLSTGVTLVHPICHPIWKSKGNLGADKVNFPSHAKLRAASGSYKEELTRFVPFPGLGCCFKSFPPYPSDGS